MKKWYTSKTLWVNVLAIAASISAGQFGHEITVESQAAILGLVNVFLRAITKEKIEW